MYANLTNKEKFNLFNKLDSGITNSLYVNGEDEYPEMLDEIKEERSILAKQMIG